MTRLSVDQVSYGGWQNCLRLSTDAVQMLVTLDVGPRILRCQLHSGPSLFYEDPSQLGGTNEPTFQLRGGHRFWTAPESPLSYEADNSSVRVHRLSESSIVFQSDCRHGLVKTLQVAALAPSVFLIRHGLTNRSESTIERAAWALSVMAPGGTALLPQPPLRQHPSVQPVGSPWSDDDLLPNRRLILWPYTDLGDQRLRLSGRLWTVEQRTDMPPCKLGISGPPSIVGYQLGSSVFIKDVPSQHGAQYPDLGASFELYTDASFLELETLSPLWTLRPGQSQFHDEHWLFTESAQDLRTEALGLSFLSEAAQTLQSAIRHASAPRPQSAS